MPWFRSYSKGAAGQSELMLLYRRQERCKSLELQTVHNLAEGEGRREPSLHWLSASDGNNCVTSVNREQERLNGRS